MTDIGVMCPRCGEPYEADFCDGDERLVSLWGDDGPVEIECGYCDFSFFVKEYVSRFWELHEAQES